MSMKETIRRKMPVHIPRKYIMNMYHELGKTRNMITDDGNRQVDMELLTQIDKMALMLGLFEEQVGKFEYFVPDEDAHYE